MRIKSFVKKKVVFSVTWETKIQLAN